MVPNIAAVLSASELYPKILLLPNKAKKSSASDKYYLKVLLLCVYKKRGVEN